ncbi:MAG: hypothetical protein E4H47_02025 [Parcubacteria group bacterium]|nr:MAG: hypothetical protein E4H47_02025 [Parcubacteria group bacterium]
MEKENLKFKEEPIFPEESGSIIDGILEKNGMIRSRDEENKKILEALQDHSKSPEEKIMVLENFPSARVAKIVADYGCKIISLEKIMSRIGKELNIGDEVAKKITDELKVELLDLIKTSKPAKRAKEIAEPIAEDAAPETKIIPPASVLKKERGVTEKDTYREPIE